MHAAATRSMGLYACCPSVTQQKKKHNLEASPRSGVLKRGNLGIPAFKTIRTHWTESDRPSPLYIKLGSLLPTPSYFIRYHLQQVPCPSSSLSAFSVCFIVQRLRRYTIASYSWSYLFNIDNSLLNPIQSELPLPTFLVYVFPRSLTDSPFSFRTALRDYESFETTSVVFSPSAESPFFGVVSFGSFSINNVVVIYKHSSFTRWSKIVVIFILGDRNAIFTSSAAEVRRIIVPWRPSSSTSIV